MNPRSPIFLSRFLGLTGLLVLPALLAAKPAKPSKPDPRSARIDAIVAAGLKEHQVLANAPIDDTTFLRRTYLEIIGRIPTPEEAEIFMAAPENSRRPELIDQLLESEGHVSHSFNYWADILRINNRLQQSGTDAEYAYRHWLKDSIRDNKPYDEFARELVSARGYIWENGAVGYYQRDRGMPLDNMSNTVRVFLGTRLECAQCHDHPFDRWTQMDYYKMAAFTYGVDARSYAGSNRALIGEHANQLRAKAVQEATGIEKFPYQRDKKRLESYIKNKNFAKYLERYGIKNEQEFRKLNAKADEAYTKAEKERRRLGQVANDLYNPIQYVSVGVKERTVKLPHDYQYDDAKPHDEVPAGTMFGSEIDLENLPQDQESIDAYAAWMTSKDNPTFSKVIANRLWKRVFGMAVVEPLDELTEHSEASNPQLMAYLEKLIKDLDYDTRKFLRILYNTQTYQREAHREEVMPGLPYYFPGPVLKRMSAEQIWDSMVVLAIPAADQYQPTLPQQLGQIARAKRIYDSLEERSPEEYMAMIGELAKISEKSYQQMDTLRKKIYKAREDEDLELAKDLGRELSGVNRDLRSKMAEIAYQGANEKSDPSKLLAAAGMKGMTVNQMDMKMTGAMAPAGEFVVTSLPKMPKPDIPGDVSKTERKKLEAVWKNDARAWSGKIKGLMRASELPSPAPRGHFLREFGQSDRETIENANRDASVPQALNLLNSSTIDILANRFSILGQSLKDRESPEEKINAIYQAMLTRPATAREIDLLLPQFEEDPLNAEKHIIWAILNTQQFLFVR